MPGKPATAASSRAVCCLREGNEPGNDATALLPMDLDDLAREGARQMIAAALRIEVEDYVDRHRDERDADGRALVVRRRRQ